MIIKYLTPFLLFLFFTKSYSQNLHFEDIIHLNKLSLSEFQDYMYNNQFLLYKANSDAALKTDSILFVNKQKLMAGFVSSRKENIVFVKNIKEDYFESLNQALQHSDFILVETKIKAKNILEKRYLNTATESIIDILITPDSQEFSSLKNNYTLIISSDSKYIRRHKRNLNK